MGRVRGARANVAAGEPLATGAAEAARFGIFSRLTAPAVPPIMAQRSATRYFVGRGPFRWDAIGGQLAEDSASASRL